MRNKNLFILTGAGFSIPFLEFEENILSTNFLTNLITKEDIYSKFIKLIYEETIEDEYYQLINITSKIYEELSKDFKNKYLSYYPNFEQIIYILELLSNFTDQRTFSKDYLSLFDGGSIDFTIAHKVLHNDSSMDEYDVKSDFKFKRKIITKIISELKEEYKSINLKFKHVFFLKEFILDVVNLFKPKEKSIDLLESFCSKILKGYNVKYYSLNYDSLVIDVLEKLASKKVINFNNEFNTGSQIAYEGQMKPSGIFRNMFNKQKPHSLFFLHGSIYYKRLTDSFNLNFQTRRKPNKFNFNFTSMLMDQQNHTFINSDGSFRYNTSMITGMNKETKLSSEPYASMFTKCRIDYFNADEVLIMGYSFSDAHINSIITNLSSKLKLLNVVDYKPSPNSENLNGDHTREFRSNFLKMMENSCFHKPAEQNRLKQRFEAVNQWQYKFDETKVNMYFNGVENYIKTYDS